MSKKKKLRNMVETPETIEVPETVEEPEQKLYPIEALVMLNGNIIEVKEVMSIFTDSYRVRTTFDTVKLVFFHAIAFVENGDYSE